MKAEIDKPDDDLGRIRERIKALKEDHLKDLERLYSFHAQDYRQEVMDQYLSLEEGQGGESDSKTLTPAEIRFQVRQTSPSRSFLSIFNPIITTGNL